MHNDCSADFREFLDILITGWRRCIGCLILQVSFRKRATNYKALLWEMTSQDKASYGSLPPCSADFREFLDILITQFTMCIELSIL